MGTPPTAETNPAAWGRWVENACIAFAIGCGQTVHYWRDESLEVDAVLSGDWGNWAVEIKTSDYTSRDLSGLLEFSRRYPEFRPMVLCDEDHTDTARMLGVEAMGWREFLSRGLE
jgi:predicted AAA+ superfamily ATPase